MNTPQGAEGAALQFARYQILANWLHDRGLDAAPSPTQIEENEEEELDDQPGPSRHLNFEE